MASWSGRVAALAGLLVLAGCGQAAGPAVPAAIHPPAWLQGSWTDGQYTYIFRATDYLVQGPTVFMSFDQYSRSDRVTEASQGDTYRITTFDPDLGWTNNDIFQRGADGTVRFTSANSTMGGSELVRRLTRPPGS